MAFESIRLAVDARGIATVTLARGDQHNAMNALMIAELHQAADRLRNDGAVRAVVLAADGKSFCAGGDLKWMREQADKDRAGRMAEARALANMFGAWNSLPKLVIARVQGPAYGGGVGLIAIADVAVAAEGVNFALTETRLGLIPATIGPFVIQRMGGGFARQVFISAKPFGLEFAVRSGLIAEAVPVGELDTAIEREIASILRCAPGAAGAAKALLQQLSGTHTEATLELTVNALADRWETAEAQEGIEAFFEKTSPSWRQH